jgi:hypothetical protein
LACNLHINPKSVKALSLTVPLMMRMTADEIDRGAIRRMSASGYELPRNVIRGAAVRFCSEAKVHGGLSAAILAFAHVDRAANFKVNRYCATSL